MRRLGKVGAVIGMIAGALYLACSSSDDASPPAADAGAEDGAVPTVDAGAVLITDPMNCVAPAATDNTQGVGGYCNPGGGQCSAAGPGGTARICTGDVPGTPAHAWFCTLPCTLADDASCGAGASCEYTPRGSICVPDACAALEDGGAVSDAGSDADADDASDDASDDGPDE